MHTSALTLSRKEESVAEHRGQGGGSPVHIPRLRTTAGGEWWHHRVGSWLLTGLITSARPLAFTCLSLLLDGTVGVAVYPTGWCGGLCWQDGCPLDEGLGLCCCPSHRQLAGS